MFSMDIGVDLGTASVLVYIKGRGVVLKEPSVVAYDRDTNEIREIGEEARKMIGRTPGNIVAIRPLRQGVISDYDITEKMLKYFLLKAMGRKTLRKPRISVCIPSGATEVEKKAVEDATYQAGAREVSIIEEPIAAAIGAGIDISKACGNMIVDIGGGTSDIAVISLGGPVVSTSVKVAGDNFDDAIVKYMRKKHNLLIGERTAEEIKISIGCAYPRPEMMTMDVRGRNLVTGLPKTMTLTSDEIMDALKEPAMQIVEAVLNVLERTPPELAADVYERGIVMTGGGSLLSGLDELIEEKTGINTMIADDPMRGGGHRHRQVHRVHPLEPHLKRTRRIQDGQGFMSTVKGYVDHIVYRNADNGYTVMEVVSGGRRSRWSARFRISVKENPSKPRGLCYPSAVRRAAAVRSSGDGAGGPGLHRTLSGFRGHQGHRPGHGRQDRQKIQGGHAADHGRGAGAAGGGEGHQHQRGPPDRRAGGGEAGPAGGHDLSAAVRHLAESGGKDLRRIRAGYLHAAEDESVPHGGRHPRRRASRSRTRLPGRRASAWIRISGSAAASTIP